MDNDNLMGRIAEQICTSRHDLGLSQARLAELAGVSRHFVVNLESGRATSVDLAKLSAVTNVLGLSINVSRRRTYALSPASSSDDEIPHQLGENLIDEQLVLEHVRKVTNADRVLPDLVAR